MLVVLHVLALIGLRLVVVTGGIRSNLHPGALLHVELADERRLEVRHLDAMEVAAGHRLAVHMPQLSADGHLHLDAVAGDVRGTRVVDAVAAVEVAVHLHVALVAAGGQQDALARLDVDHGAVRLLDADAIDLAGDRILHEADDLMLILGLGAAVLGRLGKAVPAAAVLEGQAAVLVAEVAGRAHEVSARQIRELDEQGAPAQRATAGVADLVAHRLQRRLNPLEVRGELVGQPVEVLLGDDVRLVHGAHVGAEGLHIIRLDEDNALAGGDGLAARVRFIGLVVDDDVHVRIDLDRLDVGGGTRHAVAGDDDVVLLIPGHVLARLDPAAGVLVLGLGLLSHSLLVHQAAGHQADARRAHRGALQEFLTGQILGHMVFLPFWHIHVSGRPQSRPPI